MNRTEFVVHMLSALACGAIIGLERQWRQRMTGLRTNGLVATGAAMFVMMGALIGGDSEGRIAAYVVSGVGFLGRGVILKEGFNIRGLNTVATRWCTAAVGSLAGTGQLQLCGAWHGSSASRKCPAAVGRLPRKSGSSGAGRTRDHVPVRCTCRTADEAHIRTC